MRIQKDIKRSASAGLILNYLLTAAQELAPLGDDDDDDESTSQLPNPKMIVLGAIEAALQNKPAKSKKDWSINTRQQVLNKFANCTALDHMPYRKAIESMPTFKNEDVRVMGTPTYALAEKLKMFVVRQGEVTKWCSLCTAKFETYEMFDQHLIKVHNSIESRCYICGWLELEQRTQEKHFGNKHGEITSWVDYFSTVLSSVKSAKVRKSDARQQFLELLVRLHPKLSF